jgi:pyridoxine/pyridoxamine 5'-phosphate oxidase
MPPKSGQILSFLHTQTLTVIGTVGPDAKPESAVIAFAETENLELIFGTPNSTRKYKNLQTNPNVAFVIGWDETTRTTVQYEGVAKELVGDEAKQYAEAMAAKNPASRKFMSRPDQRYFLVKPTWIRYTSQDEIFEITF